MRLKLAMASPKNEHRDDFHVVSALSLASMSLAWAASNFMQVVDCDVIASSQAPHAINEDLPRRIGGQ
jgi:hypothetical protein